MDRFTAAGLHAAALNGEDITVLSIYPVESMDRFQRYLQDVDLDEATKATRARGEGAVRYQSGGHIRFATYASIRGTQASTALCYDLRPWLDKAGPDGLASIHAMAGEVIRADA